MILLNVPGFQSNFIRKRTSLVNKGQNMLYKLCLDANTIGKYRNRCIQIYFYSGSE